MPQKLLFVLADGGRARFVERSAETGDFVTIDEIDNGGPLRRLRGELHASPPVRSHNSLGVLRHSVGREGFVRKAKEAFMAQVAEHAVTIVQREELAGVFLVAPSQLIGVLHDQLEGRAAIAGQVSKDLTKSPDHELAAWLDVAVRPEASQ